MYESVRRKWTKDRAIISAVKGEPFLDKLLSQNVTFLEDEIFNLKTINLRRKTFRRLPKDGHMDSELEEFFQWESEQEIERPIAVGDYD